MDDAPTGDRWPGFSAQRGRPSHIGRRAGLLLAAVLVVAMIHGQGGSAAARASTTRGTAALRLLILPKAIRNNFVFTSVSCVDRTYCIAVGVSLPASDTGGAPGFWPTGNSAIVQFNGRRWSTMASPLLNDAGLNGVNCISRTSCTAVGEQFTSDGYGSTLVERYSGVGWKIASSPDATEFPLNSNFLQSVSCTGSGECVAVGGDYDVSAGRAEKYAPLVERESGQGWAITPLASPETGYFTSVSCSLAQCVAVGDGTASDIETHGGSWMPLPGYTSELSGVSCRSSHFCTAVGTSSPAEGVSLATLTGRKWAHVPGPETPNPTATNTLNAISCFASDSCVAVGQFIGSASPTDSATSAFGPLVAVETHRRWSVPPAVSVSSRNEPWVFSVSCPSAHVCLAVGTTLMNAIHAPSGGFRALAILVRH